MQLRKMTLMFAALSAVSLMMACDGGGRDTLACASDTDCLESEICHPQAGVCVQTCSSAADCPDSAKTCDPLSGTSNSICKCKTDELCQGDTRLSDASGLSCSTTYSVCTDQTATKCTSNAQCAANQTCNTTTGACEDRPAEGAACSGQGQTTCAYGQFCSSSKCAAVPAPTCQNYTNFTRRSELGTTGPIIFNASVVSAATDSFCGSGTNTKRVKVNVSAYSSTPFPQTKNELNGLFYVQVAGTRLDGADTISSSAGNYTVTGSNRERADFVMSFCVAPSSDTLSLGVYFTGGNFFCYQADY
ncbi:hypothetical protein [Melittangium boletus]|uniref:Lipoprotein n=1 Tax=Melittangium boletus DSM 14713 TaxID=1294270 RepID=A0A250IMF8_9BACT|nr:hypothetical protein [Melittangium boletus]ATB32430.1 hypothetical protein MEBOL_005908 [Melittangium boletus DSM 14713]